MSLTSFSANPAATGLYRPEHEHDACGVAMVATMRGHAGHDIVQHALTALRNLDHRGATGADPAVGDGAGILTQIPDEFFRGVTAELGLHLPPKGTYVAGMAYLPRDEAERDEARRRIATIAYAEGLQVLGWRDVPHAEGLVGRVAEECMPHFALLFAAPAEGGPATGLTGIELDRVALALRKRAQRQAGVVVDHQGDAGHAAGGKAAVHRKQAQTHGRQCQLCGTGRQDNGGIQNQTDTAQHIGGGVE